MHTNTLALVTGANKGIGHEIARQLAQKGITVLLDARDAARGQDACDALARLKLDVHFLPLDQTVPASIASAAAYIQTRFHRLDILINNAAIMLDKGPEPSLMSLDILRSTLETNLCGAVAVTQALLPLLRQSPAGRIVNVSSCGGQLSVVNYFSPAYQISKASLNSFTVLLAHELRSTKIKVNCVCPGWVKTSMGGTAAPLTAEQGADTPVWLATLPDEGPTGGFFHKRGVMAW